MKTKNKVTIALVAMLMVGFMGVNSVQAQEKKAAKEKKVETLKYWVSMDCGNCQAKIEKNIAFEKGVTDLQVDLPTKIVTVKYRPGKTSADKIEKAIQKLGFTTEVIKEEEKTGEKEGK